MNIDPSTSPLSPAATLVLVREHAGELQAYLLRRSPSSGFMPGLFVFPGGRVDPADCDEAFWIRHLDMTPQAVGARLGGALGMSAALRYAVAAIRETFEEAGVLFASTAGAGSSSLKRASGRRLQAGLRRDWLRNGVETEGWTLTLSALSPWAHWITPVGMPRRFDTRFFVASLPEGQDGRPDLRETTEGRWLSPRRALAQNLSGRTPLSPPTLVTLHELLGFPTLSGLRQGLNARAWGAAIFPRMVPLAASRGVVLIEPWDPLYGQEDFGIDPGKLPERILPPGAPFSRLWNDRGVWKPFR